jgi:hypothetical protein
VNAVNHSSSSSKMAGCSPVLGHVVDRVSRRNVSICTSQRVNDDLHQSEQKVIYVSQSNQLQLVIKSDLIYKFIVRLGG